MNFQKSMEEGYVKKVPPDRIKAQGLIKASQEAIITAAKIPFEPNSFKSIIRELYEGLRQYCEALGILRGYKFSSHEAITHFLAEVLKENTISARFDRYRKLRNGINYYGDDVAPETVKEALKEIPEITKMLKKHESKEN